VAAIIVDKERILLVRHVHPDSKFAWWVPPESVFKEANLKDKIE